MQKSHLRVGATTKVVRPKPQSYGGSGAMSGAASSKHQQLIAAQQQESRFAVPKSTNVSGSAVNKTNNSRQPMLQQPHHRKQASLGSGHGKRTLLQQPQTHTATSATKTAPTLGNIAQGSIPLKPGADHVASSLPQHKKSQSAIQHKLLQLLLKGGQQPAHDGSGTALSGSIRGALQSVDGHQKNLAQSSNSQEAHQNSFEAINQQFGMPISGETAEQQLIRILATDKVQKGPTVLSYQKAAHNIRKSYDQQSSSQQPKQHLKTAQAHPQKFNNNSFSLSHNSGSHDTSMNMVTEHYLKQSAERSLKQPQQPGTKKQAAPGISSSFKVSGGHKLLSKQSKVISSANAVKKPAPPNMAVKHQKTKTSFIGQHDAPSTNLLTKQAHQPQAPHHHRVKSDVNGYNVSAPNNQAIQAFQINQSQRGKVGKILKNNFLAGEPTNETVQDLSAVSANFGQQSQIDQSQTQGLTGDMEVSPGFGLQINTLDSNSQHPQNIPNESYKVINTSNSLIVVPPNELNSFVLGNATHGAPPPTQTNNHAEKRDKAREPIKTDHSQQRLMKSIQGQANKAVNYQNPTNKTAPDEQEQQKTTKEKYLELQIMYNDLLEKHQAITGKASEQLPKKGTTTGSDGQNSGTNMNMRIKRYQNNRQSYANKSGEGATLTASDEITDVSPVQQEHGAPAINRQQPHYRQAKTMLTNQQQQQQAPPDAQTGTGHHRPAKSMQFANSKIIDSRELKQPVHTRTVSGGNNSLLNSGRGDQTQNETITDQHVIVTKNMEGQNRKMSSQEQREEMVHGVVQRPPQGIGTPDRAQVGLIMATQSGTHRRSVSDGSDAASLLKFKSKFLHQSGNPSNPSQQQPVNQATKQRKVAGPGQSHKLLQQAPHPAQPSHQDTVEDESDCRPRSNKQSRYLQPTHTRLKSDDLQKQVIKNNSAYFYEQHPQKQIVDQPQIIVKKKATTTPTSNKNRFEPRATGLTNSSSSQLLQAAQFAGQQQLMQYPQDLKQMMHPSVDNLSQDMNIQENSPCTGSAQYRNTSDNHQRPMSGVPVVPRKGSKGFEVPPHGQIQTGRPVHSSQISMAGDSIEVGVKKGPRVQSSKQQPQDKRNRQLSTSSTRHTASQQQNGQVTQFPPQRQVNNLFAGQVMNAPAVATSQEIRLSTAERREGKGKPQVAPKKQQVVKMSQTKAQQLAQSKLDKPSAVKKLTSGQIVQHKRVKSDANDQNRLQRYKEVMFVVGASPGHAQVADRSMKTLPKKMQKGNSLSQRISPNVGGEGLDEKQLHAQRLQNFIIEGSLEKQDEDEEKYVNVSYDELDDPESVNEQSQENGNRYLEDNERSQINNFQEQVLSKSKNSLNHKQQQQSQQPQQIQPAVGVNIVGNHSISGGMHEQKQQKYRKMMQQQRMNAQHSKSEVPPQMVQQDQRHFQQEEATEEDERHSQRQNRPQMILQGGLNKYNQPQQNSNTPSNGISPMGQYNKGTAATAQQAGSQNPSYPQITFNMQISPKFVFNNGQPQQVAKSQGLTKQTSSDLQQHKAAHSGQEPQLSLFAQKNPYMRQHQAKQTQQDVVERGATPPFGPGGLVPQRDQKKKEQPQIQQQQSAGYLINLQENNSSDLGSEEDESSHLDGTVQNSLGECPQAEPMFVPMNSLNYPSARSPEQRPGPANSAQRTKEPQELTWKSEQSKKGKSLEKSLQIIQNERIETQDSLQQDPTISPRTKAVRKLTRHIKVTVADSDVAPQTTVEFYRVGQVLGKGAFGKVNLALHLLTQSMVAIKSINKTYFSEDSQIRKVKQEVMILKRTHHRNIVKLYEYFETQKHILFVIELAAGGDLLSYVRKRRNLKEDVAKSVFKQIIDALGYCHSRQILHRDIKLDNILLSINGEIKICDFGVGKIVRPGETMTEQCGTPAYIAPEILLDQGYEGFGVDIWSAGVVLYAMLYGSVPFKANDLAELQRHIIAANYQHQSCISREAKDLLDRLLEKDPRQRITIGQIRKHSWMKDAKETCELFTSAEKKYLQAEFVDSRCMNDRFNRNQETDPFLEDLESKHNSSVLKNAETKSVILAPFNSTKSNMNMEEEKDASIDSFVKELLLPNKVIKFGKAVREINKQYEVNNNQELDNGVYHDYWVKDQPDEDKDDNSQHDSLQSSFEKNTSLNGGSDDGNKKKRKKNKNSGNELERLENMMKGQEVEQPYSGIEDQNKLAAVSSANTQDSNLQQEIKAPEIKIDDEILKRVIDLGFTDKMVRQHLTAKDLNCATTSYFLWEGAAILAEAQPDSEEFKQNN